MTPTPEPGTLTASRWPGAFTRRMAAPFWLRAGLLATSALLCAGLAICYALQPDACVALTIWPPWLWLLPGISLTWLSWSRTTRRSVLGITCFWLLFLLVCAEEPRSLARMALPRSSERGLRVVSLNCGGGSPAAAAEVATFTPDLVLLQEAPTEPKVRELGKRLFGADANVHCGLDTAILVRGKLQPSTLPRGTSHFVAARVRLASVGEVEVVSLRLVPPVVRFDLWSPGCWQDYEENRKIRREQLREVTDYLASIPPHMPVLLGGDFNAPAGDAIFRLLQPQLHDAFTESGVGWGNTALNDMPVSRIDQLWVSRPFRALSLQTVQTQNSDHRMIAATLTSK